NAPDDTIITAESITTADVSSPLGNYSMAPIDAHGFLNGTSRFACLHVRCPGFLTTGAAFDIVVNVTMETTSGHCLARSQSALLRSGNIISRSTGDDSFRITLENGDNYGPKFGVYIGTGFRDRAVYQAQHSCYSGSHFDHVTMVAENGAIASYQC
ncbi:hypothetical protein MAR_002621, partial [Mya arenaria]